MTEKLQELEKIRATIRSLQDECDRLYNEYIDNTPELEDMKDEAFDYIFDYLYNDIDYLDKIKQLLFETENV